MPDFLHALDLPLRVALAIALHGTALLIAGSLALIVGAGAARELGDTGPRWRWFGWFAILKGLAVVGSLAMGVAHTTAPPVFFTGLYLAVSLPAWLAGAQFAWASRPERPHWATPRVPALLWIGAVAVTALASGWSGLEALNVGLAASVGVAMLATLIGEIRALDRRGRARAAISLVLVMAGLGGLAGLDLLGARFHGRLQNWTMNTLGDFVRGDFKILFVATGCAIALALGWWLWMRLHVTRIAPRGWLRRSLWLVPAGVLLSTAACFGLLNHMHVEGNQRSDRILELRVRTAVAGLELAGWRESADLDGLAVALRRIADANPDIETIALARMEDDRLVPVVGSAPEVPLPARPWLWRQKGAPDERFATAREAFTSEFMQDEHGSFALRCEPWPRPGAGWLVFRIGFDAWAQAMGPVLVQTAVITLLACVVVVAVVVFLIQRTLGAETRLDYVRASAASEAKTGLLVRASHELRTPIQGILGYADLLARSDLAPDQHDWLESLRTHGRHLLRLVNDLLDFGALQSGRLTMDAEPLDPARVAHEALSAVRPQADERRLACSFLADAQAQGWVLGDATRLRQILVNLLGNAVKFTERGSVTLRIHSFPTPPADDGVERVGLRFAVADTGPGIEAEDLPGLFDPRGRLRRHPAEGAGLGLALARGLCEAMGGDLRVESEPGVGSTFTATVVLPVAPPAEPAPEAERPRLARLGLRTLVVEDNTALRLLLGAWMEELRCIPVLAADGEAALKAAAGDRFDAVILDLDLPGIDGCEVARRLRARGASATAPHLRIVGLSAHAGKGDREAALAAGMDVFLSKPVELDTLAQALRPHTTVPTKPTASTGGLLGSRLLSEAQSAAVRAAAYAEIPLKLAILHTAVDAGDWTLAAATAHYLHNTADVLGARELRAACGDCEAAARTGDTRLAAEAAARIARICVAPT